MKQTDRLCREGAHYPCRYAVPVQSWLSVISDCSE